MFQFIYQIEKDSKLNKSVDVRWFKKRSLQFLKYYLAQFEKISCIKDLIQDYLKFLLFAHHQLKLDTVNTC